MIEATADDAKINGIRRIGSQPIALAAAALVIIVLGAGSIALWRAYSGSSPEQDRIAAVRQVQARAALASEQLAEKTKALDESQQESIDQLQVVQDQLRTFNTRCLPASKRMPKRLSEQVGDLSGAIDNLRQSFANAQSPEHIESALDTKRLDPIKIPRQAPQTRPIATLTPFPVLGSPDAGHCVVPLRLKEPAATFLCRL